MHIDEKQRSSLDLYQTRRHSQIIATEDGKLYQISEVTPAQLRQQTDYQRNQQANQLAYLFLGIGAVFAGFLGLIILGSVLISATSPAPPVVNPNCWIGCSGSANQ